jgi:hypothetical protein
MTISHCPTTIIGSGGETCMVFHFVQSVLRGSWLGMGGETKQWRLDVLNIDRELPLGMLLFQFMHHMLEWWGQVEPAPTLVPWPFWVRPLEAAILSRNNVRFELRNPDLVEAWNIYVLFRINLNGFRDLLPWYQLPTSVVLVFIFWHTSLVMVLEDI